MMTVLHSTTQNPYQLPLHMHFNSAAAPISAAGCWTDAIRWGCILLLMLFAFDSIVYMQGRHGRILQMQADGDDGAAQRQCAN